MTGITTRFAPSPTGYLHLGNLRSAFFSFLLARQNQKLNLGPGKFIIRIDDTDTERSRDIYTAAILKDLDWLALDFDEICTQSQRTALYENFFNKLLSTGAVYECFETDSQLKARDKQPYRYNDETPQAPNSTPGYWRFRLPAKSTSWRDLVKGRQSISYQSFSDPVIRRSNGQFTYNFTSVCDDIELGVTHVVRGEDHTSNTAVQKAIFAALGHDDMLFAHLPFLVNSQGQGLSKRIDSLNIKHFRDSGILPNAMLSFIFALGQDSTSLLSLEQMIKSFDIVKYCGAMPKVMADSIYSLNSKACHKLAFTELKNYWSWISNEEISLAKTSWPMVRENIGSLKDIPQWQLILREWSQEDASGIIEKIKSLFPDVGIKVLKAIKKEALNTTKWNEEELNSLFKTVSKHTQIKGQPLFMSIRLAITKIEHGSNLKDIMLTIGKDEFLNRLNYVMAYC